MTDTARTFSSGCAFNASRFGLRRAACASNGATGGGNGGGTPENAANPSALPDKDALCAKIADIIQDYRKGEIAPRTPEDVGKWISQFDEADQLLILEEMAHILERMYFSEAKVRDFIRTVVSDQTFTGGDPAAFWRKAGVLDLQTDGSSQKTMLSILDDELRGKYGYGRGDCQPDGKNFVYLDDGVFSGNQAVKERCLESPPGHIRKWLEENPGLSDFTLHMIVIAPYMSGVRYVDIGFNKITANRNGKIKWPFLHCAIGRIIPNWRNDGLYVHNRPDNVGVLWPRCLPSDPCMLANPDVEKWVQWENQHAKAGPGKDVARPEGQAPKFFKSEKGRHVLEQAFIRKGAYFCSRDRSGKRNEHTRPLGNQVWRGWGFGAMFVTYRNCPNNCPLALWWEGDGWHPLFHRRH